MKVTGSFTSTLQYKLDNVTYYIQRVKQDGHLTYCPPSTLSIIPLQRYTSE